MGVACANFPSCLSYTTCQLSRIICCIRAFAYACNVSLYNRPVDSADNNRNLHKPAYFPLQNSPTRKDRIHSPTQPLAAACAPRRQRCSVSALRSIRFGKIPIPPNYQVSSLHTYPPDHKKCIRAILIPVLEVPHSDTSQSCRSGQNPYL